MEGIILIIISYIFSNIAKQKKNAAFGNTSKKKSSRKFNPVSGKGISVSVEHLNIALVVYIFAVAMVAISAMVLPGISGSRFEKGVNIRLIRPYSPDILNILPG